MKKQKPLPEVVYLCDGEDPRCKGEWGCFYVITDGIRGGCRHTSDPKHAKYGAVDHKKHPERFDKFKSGDQVRYYEREEES